MPRGIQLGIVTGLKSEAKLLRGLDVACISVGGKAQSAPDRIARLIAEGATGLVSFGIAGALHPGLGTGDVVVADAVMDETGQAWHSNPAWVHAFRLATSQPSLPGLDAARRPGNDEKGGGQTILGLDRLLSSPHDKAAAFARTGALAIDMESHHVARAAAAHGLPFLAVRAISDRADEVLPACLADFVDGEGRTRMSAVLAALIFRRVKLGDLIATGRASRRAHQALFGCRGAVAGLR